MLLLTNVRERFLEACTEAKSLFEVFAPGRVNLIGEHTDYNGGMVLPFALDLGVSIRCSQMLAKETSTFLPPDIPGPWIGFVSEFSHDVLLVSVPKITNFIMTRGRSSIERDQLLLPAEIQESWSRYGVGAVVHFLENVTHARAFAARYCAEDVLLLHISSSLPVGSGLSSSAALCTGLLSSLSVMCGSFTTAEQIARAAMSIEHRFSGTKCGLMDQLAVMCSRRGHYTSINFIELQSTNRVKVESVRAHSIFNKYTPVAIHTGVTHSLADSEYNQRRASCEMALKILNAKMAMSASSLGEYSTREIFRALFGIEPEVATQETVRKILLEHFSADKAKGDPELLSRVAAHAVFENIRVRNAVEALISGDVETLDVAMRESHVSLRDDYRVSCKELDIACTVVRDTALSLGSRLPEKERPIVGPRMTGGGFGGSTVQLVHNGILDALVTSMKAKANPYTADTGKTPTIIVSPPQNGLRIAIL